MCLRPPKGTRNLSQEANSYSLWLTQKIALDACGCVCTLPGWSGLVFGGGEGEVGRRGRRSRSPRRRAGGRSALGTAALSWRLAASRLASGGPGNFWMWRWGVGAGSPRRRGSRGGRKAGFPVITPLTHAQVAKGGRRVSKAKRAVILRKQLFTLSPAAGDRAQPSPPPRPPAFPAGPGCAAARRRGRQVMGEILHQPEPFTGGLGKALSHSCS